MSKYKYQVRGETVVSCTVTGYVMANSIKEAKERVLRGEAILEVEENGDIEFSSPRDFEVKST